jgi:hypothetical protein
MNRCFGPFADIPSKEIRLAGFSCKACRQPVEKWVMRYFPELGDFMGIFACQCVSAGCWQLENPPQTTEHWSRLVRLARKNRSEFVSISPRAAELMHGQTLN